MPYLQCSVTLYGFTVITKSRHNIHFWVPCNSTTSTVYTHPTMAEIDNFSGRKVSSNSETVCSVQEKSHSKLTMGIRESPLHIYCKHVPPLSTTSESHKYVFYQEIKWIFQISIMCWQSPDFEEGTIITIRTTDKINCAKLQTGVGRCTWLWIRHVINVFMVLIFI